MGVRRSTALTTTFAAVNSASPPNLLSGISWASGDVKISKDGGAFANTTNLPTELGSTGIYSLALTAAEMNCKWMCVLATKTGMQPAYFMGGTNGDKGGAVVSNGGNTATTFQTDLAEATTDFWKDAMLLFTSGSLAGQVKRISAFNPTTDFVTLASAFTAAPSTGDLFTIVNI